MCKIYIFLYYIFKKFFIRLKPLISPEIVSYDIKFIQ